MIPNHNDDENIHVNIIENNIDSITNNDKENNNHDNDDNHYNDDNEQLEILLKEIEDSRLSDYLLYEHYYANNINDESQIITHGLDYDMNYNLKQLIRICDYYGISKDIKINKLKKNEIINFLLDFEENDANTVIVYKRKQLWYFLSELKNDKFMKKYVIW
jgi:hypothetical protein